jgi:hypothetical protein
MQQNTDAAKASSDLPDGLFVPVADDTSAHLRFVPLHPPTTAEVEELTRMVAGRLTDRLAAASEEESDYLDPELAALAEALLWSRDAPPAVSPYQGGRATSRCCRGSRADGRSMACRESRSVLP